MAWWRVIHSRARRIGSLSGSWPLRRSATYDSTVVFTSPAGASWKVSQAPSPRWRSRMPRHRAARCGYSMPSRWKAISHSASMQLFDSSIPIQ